MAETKTQIDNERADYIRSNRKCSITLSMELLNDNQTVIKSKKNLYIFNGKYYDLLDIEDMENLYHKFVMKYGIYDRWKSGTINEVIKSIRCYEGIKNVEINNDSRYICLNNGILDVNTKQLFKHSPEFLFDTYINIDYEPEQKNCPIFIQYLSDVFSGEQEYIDAAIMLGGYLLDSSYANMKKCNKMFLFDGAGGSGKSTLLDIYAMFFSPEQITSLSLEDLAGKGFEKELMIKSRINLSREQKRSYLDAENIKQIVSGEPLTLNRKYDKAITFTPKMKELVACNGLPNFNDTSEGIYRRLYIFRFDNMYKDEQEYNEITEAARRLHGIFKKDPDLFEKIQQEKSAILNLFLEGLEKLKKNNFIFPAGKVVLKSLTEYKTSNDAVREFLEENYEVDENYFTPVKEVFNNYRNWHRLNIQDSGALKFRVNEMGRRIKEVFLVNAHKEKKMFPSPDTGLEELMTCYPLRLKAKDFGKDVTDTIKF